jgi:hypothetical protein
LTVFDTSSRQLTTGEEVIRAIKNNQITVQELGKINNQLFNSTKNPQLKIAIAEDIANSKGFIKNIAPKTEKEALKSLQTKGYTLEESRMILDAYKRSGKNLNKSIKKTKKTAYNTHTTVGTGTKSMWKRFRNSIIGLTLGKTLLKLALLGLGIWAIYSWFLDEDETGIADCLKRMIPEDDWRAMVKGGLEYVLISETGEPTIDDAGGGKFWPDGKFESIDGNLKGTWDEGFGGGVTVDVNGIKLELPCDGAILPDEDEDSEEGGEIIFTPCQNFPFEVGCESDKIIELKKCLGMSDTSKKFDETLKLTLKRNGYGESITEDIYNKIIEKCREESLSDYERFGIEAMKNVKGITTSSSPIQDF